MQANINIETEIKKSKKEEKNHLYLEINKNDLKLIRDSLNQAVNFLDNSLLES